MTTPRRFVSNGNPASARSQLRTRQVQLTLCAENIGIKICYPLASARRDIEVTYRHLDLRCDVIPIELRVLVDDVRGRIVAELFVQTDFFKFVEQCICLFQVVWIAELTDEIGSSQQQTLLFDQVVVRGR